jgi:Rps23 Pro-64 3,4-dihydroxylase Tpa1-like proline 4-hydroxylase
MMKIKKINNFFADDDIDLINSKLYHYATDILTSWDVNLAWKPELKKGYNSIISLNLRRKEYKDIFEILKKTFLEKLNIDLDKTFASVKFTLMQEGSGINWHDDSPHKASATIYLNDSWHYENGGLFLYENPDNKEEFIGFSPKYNQCILIDPPLNHCVTRVIGGQPRVTIQIFIPKDENIEECKEVIDAISSK